MQILHVSVFCRLFCCSIPTKLLQKFHHLACCLTSNFLTVFLDKLQNTVCISLLAITFCKGCEFLYIFLNNKILITLKVQLEFLMQNTNHYMFSNPRNVNSCKENFTNYSRLVIRTTNLYCENVIYLSLTHALPGRRPMAFVTFSASTKLPFEIFLFFCIFIYTKLFG